MHQTHPWPSEHTNYPFISDYSWTTLRLHLHPFSDYFQITLSIINLLTNAPCQTSCSSISLLRECMQFIAFLTIFLSSSHKCAVLVLVWHFRILILPCDVINGAFCMPSLNYFLFELGWQHMFVCNSETKTEIKIINDFYQQPVEAAIFHW